MQKSVIVVVVVGYDTHICTHCEEEYRCMCARAIISFTCSPSHAHVARGPDHSMGARIRFLSLSAYAHTI